MNSSTIHERIFKFQQRVSRHYNRIFILPTRFGAYFIAIIFVLFLMSLSYGHSLAITGTFLFVSVVVVSAYYTNFNLSGLKCAQVKGNLSLFAGEVFSYPLMNSWGKPRVDVDVELSLINRRSHQEIKLTGFASLAALSREEIKLSGELKRGVYKVKRIKVSTDFPFGLFRSWMFLEPSSEELEIYVYPALRIPGISSGRETTDSGGVLEFYEHTPYREGEETKRIDWKIYSRTHELYQKHYYDFSLREELIDRRAYASYPIEEQLSFLCFKVLELSHAGMTYALVLDDEKPIWGHGKPFERECLSRLCEF